MEATIYNKIRGWIVEGTNTKRDGQLRNWHQAKLTGKFRIGSRGDRQLEIVEQGTKGMKKWLSLESFTGTIGEIKLVEGQRPDGQQTFNW